MERKELVISLLNIADYLNYNEEVSPSIADRFINKYSKEKKINDTIAAIIKARFKNILAEAARFRKIERNTLNSLY